MLVFVVKILCQNRWGFYDSTVNCCELACFLRPPALSFTFARHRMDGASIDVPGSPVQCQWQLNRSVFTSSHPLTLTLGYSATDRKVLGHGGHKYYSAIDSGGHGGHLYARFDERETTGETRGRSDFPVASRPPAYPLPVAATP